MEPKNTPELIEALGGVNAVASAIGLSPSTVSSMKKVGIINDKHWRRIIDHANAPRLNPPLTREMLAAFNEVGRQGEGE